MLLSNNPKPPGSKPTIHHLADWIQHFPTAFFCLKPEKKSGPKLNIYIFCPPARWLQPAQRLSLQGLYLGVIFTEIFGDLVGFWCFFSFSIEDLSETGMAFLPQQLRLLSPLPSIQPCAASVSADGLRRAMSYAGVFSMGMGERYKQRERGR